MAVPEGKHGRRARQIGEKGDDRSECGRWKCQSDRTDNVARPNDDRFGGGAERRQPQRGEEDGAGGDRSDADPGIR